MKQTASLRVFELICSFIQSIESEPVETQGFQYFASFKGSWFLEFEKHGAEFRLAYDGRDEWLALHRKTKIDWEEMEQEALPAEDNERLLMLMQIFIGKIPR